jgi:hypothetical protein
VYPSLHSESKIKLLAVKVELIGKIEEIHSTGLHLKFLKKNKLLKEL